jgi:tRNA threonylcarbamoyladenosine biosynthesis protein TsaB
MRILAIETVGTAGTVAALDDDRLMCQRPLATGQRSAQSLAPGIDQLLHQAGWKPTDVQLVAVSTGPGSFTGLRIGVTTAKTFAYAVGCEVIGVHSLAAIALRVPRDVLQVQTVLDAQRGELFVADFELARDTWWKGGETTRIVDRDQWLHALAAGTVVSGPGLLTLRDRLPDGVESVDPALWAPTAEAVGRLAWRMHQSGVRDSVFGLLPHYYRRTAAEEQWERKNAR